MCLNSSGSYTHVEIQAWNSFGKLHQLFLRQDLNLRLCDADRCNIDTSVTFSGQSIASASTCFGLILGTEPIVDECFFFQGSHTFTI